MNINLLIVCYLMFHVYVEHTVFALFVLAWSNVFVVNFREPNEFSPFLGKITRYMLERHLIFLSAVIKFFFRHMDCFEELFMLFFMCILIDTLRFDIILWIV